MHKKPIILSLLSLGCSLQLTAQHTIQSDSNSVQHLKDVVVTGQYNANSLKNSVYQVKVIDAQKIQSKGASSIQQLLSTEVGIQFSNDKALGASDISLMGMGGRNIKILLDGVPLVDRGDLRESINQIDVSQIERIEIIQGPMSILYGSDALAGVMNIITKKNTGKHFHVNASIQEESAGKEYKPIKSKGLHSQQINLSGNYNHFNAMLGFVHNDFTGYGADSLDRNHSWKPKEQFLPSARIAYRKGNLAISYRNDYVHETISTKGPINFGNYKAQNQDFTTNKWSHQFQYQQQYKKLKWDLVASLVDYKRRTKTELVDFLANTQTLTNGIGDQDVSTVKSKLVRGNLYHQISDKWIWNAGFEINHDIAQGQRIAGNPEFSNYAIFFTSEYKCFDKIKIKPGLRFSENSLYQAPPIIPSVHIMATLTKDISFRMAYAMGYRAPSLRELYFDFQDANHAIKGNTNLLAEESQSYTGSLLYQNAIKAKNVVQIEWSGFYNRYHNLINYAVNPNNTAEYMMMNVDQYRTSGVSIEPSIRTDHWYFKVAALYIGRFNPDYPYSNGLIKPMQWSLELQSEMQYRIEKSKTQLSIFYKYTGKRNVFTASPDAQNNIVLGQTTTQAFHNAEFNVTQRLHPYLQLQAGVRNLFNISVLQNTISQSGMAHNTNGAIPFSYGRSVFLKLLLNFSK